MRLAPALPAFFLLLHVFSCTDKIDLRLCDKEEDLGRFELSPGAELTLPYGDTLLVIFADTAGAEISLRAITVHPIAGGTIASICPYDTTRWIFKKYDYIGKTTRFTSDSLPFRMRIDLAAISTQNLQTPDESDHLQFELFGPSDPNRYYSVFGLLVDGPSVLEPLNAVHLPVWEPAGKSFMEVYKGEMEIEGQMVALYYNLDNGLVGFRDFAGKEWVFERVE